MAKLSNKHENSLAIFRAVCSLGRSLGLTITAGGVETNDQLQTVRHEGCIEIQGYLVSAPLPAEALRAKLAQQTFRTLIQRNFRLRGSN